LRKGGDNHAANVAARNEEEELMKTEQLVEITDVELDGVAGGVNAAVDASAKAKAGLNLNLNLGLCLDLGLGLGLDLGILKC
jgi:hypothetical protein